MVEDFPSDPDEASRVAACFVQGARWQFKGWPFKGVDRGDMVDCFEHVRGFYLRFQDEAVPKARRDGWGGVVRSGDGWGGREVLFKVRRKMSFHDASLTLLLSPPSPPRTWLPGTCVS